MPLVQARVNFFISSLLYPARLDLCQRLVLVIKASSSSPPLPQAQPLIAVDKPIEMAKWYKEALGFNFKFSVEDEEKGVASSRTAAIGLCLNLESFQMSCP
jgi:hypothetical protein